MRAFLTFLALALVALLSVALIAPRLVDWSSHRDGIAQRLSAITGGEVTLTGPVALELLPTPYFSVGEGSVTAPGPNAPRLAFASARLELGLLKLMSGAFRFTEIRLGKPVLTVARAPDGTLNLPAPPAGRADAIGFDRLVVEDGTISVARSGGAPALEIADVWLDGDAASLAGPVRVSGRFAGPGGAPVAFRLASEKSDGGRTPLRAGVEAGPGWPAIEFDGALAGRALSGAATLVGAAAAEGGTTIPWRASGQLEADATRATLRPAEFRFGPDERALRGEGSATLAFGAPLRLSLDVKAKQANLDGLLHRKGESAAAPFRALAALASALAPAIGSARPVAVDATLSAGQIILGGETLANVSGALNAPPGRPLHARFDAGLPGESRIHADGQVEMGAAAKFTGAIDFASDDFDRLRVWASQGAPDFAARADAAAEALPYRHVTLKGVLDASGVALSGSALTLTLGASTLQGALAFTAPVGSDPGRLFLDMTSDSLDVAEPPNLGASMGLMADLDLSLALKANRLHIARADDADIDAGSLALKLTKAGAETRLERLSLADLGGATLEAEGRAGRDGLAATGNLAAGRLRDFALLVSRIAPGDWTRILAERADALSPAALAFTMGGAAGASVTSISAKGTVGLTHAMLSVDPGPNGQGRVLALTLDAADPGALLRQLGVPAKGSANGRAHVALNASGTGDGAYDFDGAVSMAGADLTGRGRFQPNAEGDAARLFGSAKATSANVAPLLGLLGLGGQGGAIGPVEGGADFTLRDDKWTLSRLAASVGGVKAAGTLSYRPVPPATPTAQAIPEIAAGAEALGGGGAAPPEITGELSLDRLSLASLLGAVLGAPSAPKAGARWSDLKFVPAPIAPPRTDIALEIGALDVADGLSAQHFAARLGLDKGRLDLNDFAAGLMSGVVSGRATLRRNGDAATLTGALAGEGLTIARPGFAGQVGGALDFASTGRSPAGLIEGLAGGGTLKFVAATLPRSDPAALDRTVAKAQAADAELDETNIAFSFGSELDRAALVLPDGATPVALSAGAAKLGPITIPRSSGESALSATFDLRRMSLETRLALAAPSDKLKFWSGPPPAASITQPDALDAGSKRRLDVGGLSAGLATQAIARESDRIANLEADIRERAFFNRRLKGLRTLDQREQEIQDFHAERERLTGLTQRLEAERAETARIAAEKAAAEKAAAEKAAAEKAAAERAAQERAAAEKAAAEKAAAERAAREKAEADKAVVQPELPPDIAPDAPAPPASPKDAPRSPASRDEQLGVSGARVATPTPPTRPKPNLSDPTASGLY